MPHTLQIGPTPPHSFWRSCVLSDRGSQVHQGHCLVGGEVHVGHPAIIQADRTVTGSGRARSQGRSGEPSSRRSMGNCRRSRMRHARQGDLHPFRARRVEPARAGFAPGAAANAPPAVGPGRPAAAPDIVSRPMGGPPAAAWRKASKTPLSFGGSGFGCWAAAATASCLARGNS